jgi:plasmid stabilization system protein ParE
MIKSKYHLRYLPIAVEDLTAIFKWIAADSPNRAAAFIGKIDKRIGNLEIHPFSGSIPRNEKLKDLGYRVMILDHYLVFYIVRDQIIEIHRVVHGARLLEDLI